MQHFFYYLVHSELSGDQNLVQTEIHHELSGAEAHVQPETEEYLGNRYSFT